MSILIPSVLVKEDFATVSRVAMKVCDLYVKDLTNLPCLGGVIYTCLAKENLKKKIMV